MATITVRYFAAAEDAAGTGQEEWAAPTGATLEWLRAALIEKHGVAMDRALRGGSFLIDGQVRRDPGPIGIVGNDAVEVDVLPPFAGG